MEPQKPAHEQEKDILEFWKKNNIYEKSVKQNAKGKKFYMMDGPPYATGHIHLGTALNKTLKDIAMRSHRLQGFDVFDRAGYDTHGVPIEFKIEKEIGSKSKKDIETYGVKKFIDKCKEFATQYIDVMNSEFENLGVWMDFKNSYLTLQPEYIEAIWDTFKIADKKELLYLGKYSVHVCPRCETAVAYNEIEYAKQDDTSIYVKFPLKDKKNTFLIIWTTTPWTLPANTGVMANPNFIYQELELSNGEKWIIAKDLVPKVMAQNQSDYTEKFDYTIIKEFPGKDLKGWRYENPLSKNLKMNLKNAYKVVLSSRYVTNEDGTGLVHCAPGHGREDYEVGKENGLDMPSPVALNGDLTKETGKYSGKKARAVDAEIIEDLEKAGFLVYKMKYTHDYPLCWRCKTPLLMLAQPQWFLKISDIQKKILSENEKINWSPDWMKLRMKAWLEGIGDWPVSRMRYWGTPLPIWICDKCNDKIVIGSVKELEKLSKKKVKEVHKPEIDEIHWKCKCSGTYNRVPEVLDVWFDSGVSSWAALGYPANDKLFKKFWPADLNLEGKDQVRGWWNSQLILSEIKFDKKPMDAVLEHGMILDMGKKKMSKSLGNVITPKEIIEKYSRDYLRYYLTRTSKGDDFSFNENDFKDIQNFFRVLLNVNTFVNQLEKKKSKVLIEDEWILSRLNSVLKETLEYYNSYKYPELIQNLENFLVNDVSKTYIQIIRDRSDEVYKTLNEIRLAIVKVLAPICPFITEKIWQNLRENKTVEEESIHLSKLPKANEKKINKELEKEFSLVLKVIETGLRERDVAHIGLKWPLAQATIKCPIDMSSEIREIIGRQLNVKKVEIKNNKENETITVELDTKLTPELEAEGFARELARFIQNERKKAGLVKENLIELSIDSELNPSFETQKEFIKERVNAKKISFKSETGKYSAEGEIKGKKFKISFNLI